MTLEDPARALMLTRAKRTGTGEPVIPADVRRRAARCVAAVAVDADECVELLDMLGLNASDGLETEC